MIAAFWEGVSGKLVDRLAAIAAPALVFWSGGALAWMLGHSSAELHTATDSISGQPGVVQALMLIGVVVGAAGSGLLVARLTLPVLRLLEGYWPSWLGWLRARRVKARKDRAAELEDHFQALTAKVAAGTASEAQRAEHVDVDAKLRRVPLHDHLPTRLGEILRAAENLPGDKYGIDAVKCWPHLWFVLPEEAREELTKARTALDGAAAAVVWGVLFLPFGFWSPWAIPLGLVVAALALWVWLPARAAAFGDLIVASYDLYRRSLYRALSLPPPPNADVEVMWGEALTQYLWRGTAPGGMRFLDPE